MLQKNVLYVELSICIRYLVHRKLLHNMFTVWLIRATHAMHATALASRISQYNIGTSVVVIISTTHI